MNKKILNYVNTIFKDIPNTKKALELKEEILSNLNDSFEDGIKEGKTEMESFRDTIINFGEFDELIDELKNSEENNQVIKNKSLIAISSAVAMFFLSIMSVILFSGYLGDYFEFFNILGVLMFLAFIGIGIIILIYNSQYITKEEKVEYKENKTIIKEIINIYWMIAVGIYFIISYIYNMWEYTFVYFMIAVIFSKIIKIIYKIWRIK